MIITILVWAVISAAVTAAGFYFMKYWLEHHAEPFVLYMLVAIPVVLAVVISWFSLLVSVFALVVYIASLLSATLGFLVFATVIFGFLICLVVARREGMTFA